MMQPLNPADLRQHYAAFLRDDRVLLTGHSHQAWPDAAQEALMRCFNDAAVHVDDKWGKAFEQSELVRSAVAARIGGHRDEIALGQNTHELVVRFLSALDLRARPHLVTTAGEFHTIYRQLTRLKQCGLEVTFVDVGDVSTLASRLAEAVTDRTAAVLASTVLFETSAIVPGLSEMVAVAQRHGAHVLLDAYHAFGCMPVSMADYGLDPVFMVGGGYKYAQWGEGCCFLRVPPDCELEPVFTGWFSDFAGLASARSGALGYGRRAADRFAGSTYDPISHYRAARVARFFDDESLTLPRLRALYTKQTDRLLSRLGDRDVLTPAEPNARGAFVAVRVPGANAIVGALRERGVFTDSRGDVLRFGPAPYVTDDEIDRAIDAFDDITR